MAIQLAYKAEQIGLLLDGCYGGIHVHDNSTSQAIPAGATYTKINQFVDNDTISNNITPDAANDKITITKNGKYSIFGSLNFKDGANVEWWATVFVDGVEQDEVHLNRKMGAGGDVGSGSQLGTFEVTNAPIDVDVRVRHDNALTQNMTLTYSNILCRLEGL